ncbi:phosphotransferase [Frigidibacter sp. MR17.14]|uniref:phosphotransferase n=1 Tax=Frigidibacter sp. MR17.14 TaxID=3126509 RepID=UPI003012F535
MDSEGLPRMAQAAMDHWPALAEAAGLPPEVDGLRVLVHRDQPGVRRAVLALVAGGQEVILKHAAEPWQPEHFDGCLAAMQGARAAMQGGAPRLLARLPGGQAALIARAPGRSLEELMEAAADPQEMRRLFRRGAEWLGHYQRATIGPPTAFDPSGMIARHARLREDIRQGRLALPEPARFLALSEAFAAEAGAVAGREVARAAAHGDLHPGNLLLDPPHATVAIDFNPVRLAWVGHDLADYLLAFLTRFLRPGQQPEGGWLPAPERRAFALGHGSDPFDDPVLEPLLLAAIARKWVRLASGDGQIAGSRAERLAALIRVAGRARPRLWADLPGAE